MKLFKKNIDLNELVTKIKKFIIKNIHILYMALPLIMMDLMTRYLGRGIHFYKIDRFTPNFFTLLYKIYDYFRCKYILKEYIPLEKYYTFKN